MRIEDKECWICGSSENITDHHTLPKHWKPRKNIVVPICIKCHNRLNDNDIAGLLQFSFKIEQELGRQLGLWSRMRTNLERYSSVQNELLKIIKKKDENDMAR